MRRREAPALGVEGKPANARRISETMRLSPLAEDDGVLANAGDDQAGRRRRNDVIDPFAIFEQGFDRTVARNDVELAVVAASDEALAIGMRRGAENCPIVRIDALGVALLPGGQHNAIAEPIEGAALYPVHARRRRAESKPFTALVNARGHAAHARKASSNSLRSRLRPMKTRRETRFSSGFQSRWVSPSTIMCTPCTTKRFGSFGKARMPF